MDEQNSLTESGVEAMPLDKDTRAWYLQVASQFGLPTVFLVALIYLGVIGAQWTGNKILLPIGEKHLQFLEATTKNMLAQEKSNAAQEKMLSKQNELLGTVLVTVAKVEAETLRNRELLLETTSKATIQSERMIKLLESIDEKTGKSKQ